jgi:hypothetical protein
MLGVLVVAGAILGAAVVVLCLAFYAGMTSVFSLRLTNAWYGAIVEAVPPGSRILDIGSGVSGMRTFGEHVWGSFDTFIGTVKTLVASKVQVVAIEDDAQKFKKAAEPMVRTGIKNKGAIILHNKSIYDSSIRQVFSGVNRFNVVCFGTPLMSLADPAAALRVAASLLKEGGVIYVPQVLRCPPSVATQLLSPAFKFLHIAPVAEVKRVVVEADMEVIDDLPAVGGGEGNKNHPARILVLQRSIRVQSSDTKLSGSSESNVRARKSVESEL